MKGLKEELDQVHKKENKMIDFKDIIANKIALCIDFDKNEIKKYIEIPPNTDMGDYAFPCFSLAKVLKKSPIMIAEDIKSKIDIDENIEKIEVLKGYLNFYINKKLLTETVFEEYSKRNENYGKSDIGNGKNIIVEYSAPNIAKPFHIGHLRTTIIGACLYKVYKYLGYNVIGINHLGDYGTQFGKIIEGYKMWGKDYDFSDNPIEKFMDIYVRINELCGEDEEVLERCRDNFKKLENGDPYCVEVWKKAKDLSLKEFERLYDVLGVKFDSYNGESFYADKVDEVEEILEKNGAISISEGAKIVDLEDKKLGVCMIKKSNESSTYAARDLAAILYRSRTYDFDKCLYVVAEEQNLYFKQIFEVAKYLGLPEKSVNGLIHVSYGMTRLPEGKMSTRNGNVVKVEDLLQESIDRVSEIISEKNANIENKEEETKKIGIGAILYYNLCNTLAKTQIFDWNQVLNFNGESGPYIQYIYVRTKSVLEKVDYIPSYDEVDSSKIQDKNSLAVISTLYNFDECLKMVIEKNEPSFLTRFLIELAQNYSNFYNENKILVDDEETKKARIYLTKMVGDVLKTGSSLLGMEMPNRM